MNNENDRAMKTPGRILLTAILACGCFIAAGRAMGQQAPPSSRTSASETEAGERLHILVGRSLVITSPTRIKRISIADPTIADATIITPSQIVVTGKTPGGVSMVLWNEADQSQTFELFVDLDILGLSQKIKEVFPNEPVRVEASKDLVMISGRVSSKAVADKILS